MDHPERPVRILHLVASMDRGGLETFIMNVMRRIDRRRYRFDFCPTLDRPAQYDEEIRSLGGRIIPCVRRRGIRNYTRSLGRILREGDYDVVHSHMYTFSGVVLRTTKASLESFWGAGWENDPSRIVVYYGVDLDPFDGPVDRESVRGEFGLPPNCPLIIHVGRFIPAKNHSGLISIFGIIAQRHPDVHMVLVGEGELMEAARTQVREGGLEQRVVFAGVRRDVARLMKAADQRGVLPGQTPAHGRAPPELG